MSDLPPTPQHMDKWERNKRVYESLLGMGLVVSPIPNRYDHGRIEALIVSTDIVDVVDLLTKQTAEAEGLAECSGSVTSAGVILPMKGADVGFGIGTTEGGRANVVNFPSESGGPVAVILPSD